MPPSGDKPKGSKSRRGKVTLTPHPLVAKLHPEPDTPRDLVALIGYFGPSKKTDYIRLYPDLSFRSYYDIPTNGIIYTEPTDAKDENSPTRVLVLAATNLEMVQTTHQCIEASYLQGAIAGNYLAAASLPALRPPATTDPRQCPGCDAGRSVALAPQTRQGCTQQEICLSIDSDCCFPGGGGGGPGGGGTFFFSGCIGCVPKPSVPCVSRGCTDWCESTRPILCR